MVSQGSLSMLTHFARQSEVEVDLQAVIDGVQRVVVYPDNPSQSVASFASKLACVYNTLAVAKTGTETGLHLSVRPTDRQAWSGPTLAFDVPAVCRV